MNKLLEKLRPWTFEGLSIISISIFLNLLTSIILLEKDITNLQKSYLLIAILISSIVIFVFSFYLSKKINEIFSKSISERSEHINKIRYLKPVVITLAIAIFIFLSSLSILFFHNIIPKKNQSAIELKIGYQKTALYRHIFTAQEKGYFAEQGLNVELKPFVSANQMMEAFLSDNINVLGLTNLQVGLTVEGKEPNQFKFINFLVWGKNSYPDYIIVRNDANIKTPKELEGHKMGLHPGSAVKAFSKVVFEKFGIDESKIQTISLKPPIMQSTILAGSVDALYCMDPVATTLINTDSCSVLISNPMQYIFPAPTPIAGTAVSSKLTDNNIETVKKLIIAINKAILYTRESSHNEEIAGYIAKYTPITKALALKMNTSEYWTLSEIDTKRVQELADKFFELKIVEKQIKTKKLILNYE